MAKSKEELKKVFVTGAIPKQQDFHDLIDVAGTKGVKGDTGVGVANITSDGTNITFEMTDGTTKEIPFPTASGQ